VEKITFFLGSVQISSFLLNPTSSSKEKSRSRLFCSQLLPPPHNTPPPSFLPEVVQPSFFPSSTVPKQSHGRSFPFLREGMNVSHDPGRNAPPLLFPTTTCCPFSSHGLVARFFFFPFSPRSDPLPPSPRLGDPSRKSSFPPFKPQANLQFLPFQERRGLFSLVFYFVGNLFLPFFWIETLKKMSPLSPS